ncbi:PTS glucitol/sorbitol transporter subunit IIA [Sodalis sp. RH16]|uniref:PTS glucitol/sorbitol transporter subunit IIA n=1 Tax=Sodalis sp. RH16 TaxID=3394331 RepID=UPI0039B5BE67
MKIIYESTFTDSGQLASESLEDNFIILFGEGAPKDVVEYCYIHRNIFKNDDHIKVGAIINIGDSVYSVTAVGDVASQNLRELGHITVRFDNAEIAEFPGTIHVSGMIPLGIESGQKFRVLCD